MIDYLKNVAPQIHDLFAVRVELSVVVDLLVRGQPIVIPEAMRAEILGKLHEGPIGVTKCKARAATSVWWPGMYKDIEETVATCPYKLKNNFVARWGIPEEVVTDNGTQFSSDKFRVFATN